MKKKLLVLSLAALCAASPAMAGDTVFGIDYGNTKLSDPKLDGGGAGVYAGYRFNETWAAELAYRHLLRKTYIYSGVGVDLTGTTVQASALAYLPLGESFSAFGRLGYGRLQAKGSVAGYSAKSSDNKALFGLGAEYAFSKSTAMRLEWQKLDSDTTTLSLGLKFSF